LTITKLGIIDYDQAIIIDYDQSRFYRLAKLGFIDYYQARYYRL